MSVPLIPFCSSLAHRAPNLQAMTVPLSATSGGSIWAVLLGAVELDDKGGQGAALVLVVRQFVILKFINRGLAGTANRLAAHGAAAADAVTGHATASLPTSYTFQTTHTSFTLIQNWSACILVPLFARRLPT